MHMTQPSAPAIAAIAWVCIPFAELKPEDLYASMVLRQRVFVVEQNCIYMDADGLDANASHVFGWKKGDGWQRLVAYCRLFPPRVKYAEACIGRVVTHSDVRGTGVGQALMTEAIRLIGENGWGPEIRIAAQMYLERFYEGFGFQRVTDPYVEDDIWHVDMRRG